MVCYVEESRYVLSRGGGMNRVTMEKTAILLSCSREGAEGCIVCKSSTSASFRAQHKWYEKYSF